MAEPLTNPHTAKHPSSPDDNDNDSVNIIQSVYHTGHHVGNSVPNQIPLKEPPSPLGRKRSAPVDGDNDDAASRNSGSTPPPLHDFAVAIAAVGPAYQLIVEKERLVQQKHKLEEELRVLKEEPGGRNELGDAREMFRADVDLGLNHDNGLGLDFPEEYGIEINLLQDDPGGDPDYWLGLSQLQIKGQLIRDLEKQLEEVNKELDRIQQEEHEASLREAKDRAKAQNHKKKRSRANKKQKLAAEEQRKRDGLAHQELLFKRMFEKQPLEKEKAKDDQRQKEQLRPRPIMVDRDDALRRVGKIMEERRTFVPRQGLFTELGSLLSSINSTQGSVPETLMDDIEAWWEECKETAVQLEKAAPKELEKIFQKQVVLKETTKEANCADIFLGEESGTRNIQTNYVRTLISKPDSTPKAEKVKTAIEKTREVFPGSRILVRMTGKKDKPAFKEKKAYVGIAYNKPEFSFWNIGEAEYAQVLPSREVDAVIGYRNIGKSVRTPLDYCLNLYETVLDKLDEKQYPANSLKRFRDFLERVKWMKEVGVSFQLQNQLKNELRLKWKEYTGEREGSTLKWKKEGGGDGGVK